jgi:hypothetical protein
MTDEDLVNILGFDYNTFHETFKELIVVMKAARAHEELLRLFVKKHTVFTLEDLVEQEDSKKVEKLLSDMHCEDEEDM